jgi:L(+)-tartrate dehydratase alpha subunit
MTKNQGLAVELNRPSCQDTGVLQFWLKCGTNFPYINELEGLLKEAVVQATFAAPLRHNSVETFDEYNTKKNVGKGTPTVWWDIVPNSDKCEIYAYMAGGGCTLPGKAMVLMPGAGYEGVTDFVLDQMTSYGLNACPPLLVGVGVGTSVETAALNSKKALMRPIGSHNDNANAAKMEKLLEDGINAIGLGPQGMGGKYSVMGVNIENTARHPSAIGVAVNVGCWSHRRGHIVVNPDLTVTCDTHSTWKIALFLISYGSSLPYSTRRRCATSRQVIRSPSSHTISPILISARSSALIGVIRTFLSPLISIMIFPSVYALNFQVECVSQVTVRSGFTTI